jgi:indole-3-glycerol phosphate synthase
MNNNKNQQPPKSPSGDLGVGLGILGEICAYKRLEVAQQKEAIPLSQLENIPDFQQLKPLSFKQALLRSNSGIIAEFKRRSPSKGWIHAGANVENIVKSYEASGAAAISSLTDEQFFGGGFTDFRKARSVIRKIPLLRKDFIVDEYQIYQSKAMGADVILLIAACLSPDETFRFTELAHELGMEVLLEIHNEEELAYIRPNIDVVGINNRDLKTFVTDIRHTIELAHKIPDDYVKISESGLSKPETVIKLRKAGFKGFLMGENFMKTEDPGETLKAFISDISFKLSLYPARKRVGERYKIKVCGMKCPENSKESAKLPIDMIGLIFHEKSLRYVGNSDAGEWKDIPTSIRKVGVFVDASREYILEKVRDYGLQVVQLHGKESPELCRSLRSEGLEVIKSFRVRTSEDLKQTGFYERTCDYFLFDTKTPLPGGSGKKFDWRILPTYQGQTPFFLSGGIGIEDATAINRLDLPLLYAIDLNSRFETEPGKKDIEKLREFVKRLELKTKWYE